MPTEMFVTQGWMIFPYLLAAVSGCFFIMSISKNIAQIGGVVSNVLVYVGSKTMWVLTLHLICFKLLTSLIIVMKADPSTNLLITPIYHEYSLNAGWILYSLIGVLMPIAVSLAVKFFAKRLSSIEK